MSKNVSDQLLTEIAEALSRRFALTPKVAFMGFGNAGKSSLFNAVYGEALAPVSMSTDTTKEASTVERFGVDFTDTPGFGTGAFSLEQFAESGVLDEQHLVVHVLNGASCISEADQQLHERLAESPVVCLTVVNKSDLLDEKQKEEFAHSMKEKLGFDEDEFLFVSAQTGNGVPELAQVIAALLPAAVRDAFIVQQQADAELKERRIRALIYSKACLCAAVAATPIPFADIFVLTPIQLAMVTGIGCLRGAAISEKRAMEWLSVIGSGLGFRAVARQLLKLIPIYGSVVNASVAFVGTVALGETANAWYQSDMSLGVPDLSDVFAATAARAQGELTEFSQDIKAMKRLIDALRSRYEDGDLSTADLDAAVSEMCSSEPSDA